MKNSIFILAVTSMFLASAVYSSCQTSGQKVEDAKVNVQDAKKDLRDAQNNANAEAQRASTAETWRAYRSDSEVRITDNNNQIVVLRDKIKASGNAAYVKQVDELEMKNKSMKARLEAYGTDQNNWDSFKREFDHDMNALGQAFRDLAVNNKR